jgi:UDP-2,4-diacetamido-2,4,6-trideoxy-beta-L-altropyranose hydrolase
MIVALRADASLRIGSGHIMRCLTLADALIDRGHSCVFLSRDLEGSRHDAVRSRGHELEVLDGGDGSHVPDESAPAHAAWLECGWQEDARATRDGLDRCGAGALVVDHYALDSRWEEAVAAPGLRIGAIDDLADRPHAVSLLVDQNLGRRAQDYEDLVPVDCRLLVGPRFALVSSQFARLREESLSRRAGAGMEHVMISMGGVDAQDVTSAVLECLGTSHPTSLSEVSVIMGRHAPHLERVRALAADLPLPVEVSVDVMDMAERMTRADLAVGGAGVTAWERCSLGLPSITVVLAENQRGGARALGAAGAALVVEEISELREQLPELLAAMEAGELRAKASRAAADLVDAQGLRRVCDELEELT